MQDGKQIERLIDLAGLTRQSVADEAGVTVLTLQNYIYGRATPRERTREALWAAARRQAGDQLNNDQSPMPTAVRDAIRNSIRDELELEL